MSNLTPFNSSVSRTASRQLARTMNELDRRRQLRNAQIEAVADIQALKVDAIGYVGKQAMYSVAFLSQLEGQLATLVPLATSRLQAVADLTTLAITEVVADTRRQLA